jgi:hypothetical protein
VLGWIFLPWTTLAYLLFLVFNQHELGTLGMICVAIGILVDIGVVGSGAHKTAEVIACPCRGPLSTDWGPFGKVACG